MQRRAIWCCAMRAAQATRPEGLVYMFDVLRKFGAGEEIRTLDPNLGKVVLYH
jgi:hypothetical protein